MGEHKPLPEHLDAVVLAAAPNHGALRATSPEPFEALIPVAGRPMVALVVQALAAARRVGRIVCVGPPAVVEAAREGLAAGGQAGPQFAGVAPGPGLLGSLEAGLQAAATPFVLVATADIPLLEPAMVDDFVARCEDDAQPLDVWYSVVERSRAEARYPGLRRTWVRLADGSFSGGNLALVRKEAVARAGRLLALAVEARKQPLALARLLGLRVLVLWLAGRLRVADVERRVHQLTGLRGRAVVTPHVEVGIDVDKPEDLALVRRYRGSGGPLERMSPAPSA